MLQNFQARFKFIADALNAEGGFYDSSYLIRYPRESTDKYARRKEVAWYLNSLRSACSDFVGYLSKRQPIRDVVNPMLQSIVDDADMRGNSLDIFWARFMVEAKARGSMLLLVDMPQSLPPDQASQIEQRAVPYLVAIEPERIINFELDNRGLLVSLEIYETWPVKSLSSSNRIRGWDTMRWWIKNGESLRIEEHGLGICPVLIFTESGNFPHIGDFAQIADLSRRYFNACSERDEILRSQTFSLLTYQVPPELSQTFDSGGLAQAIGTNNMLIHHGLAPSFIAPPDGPATIYTNIIAELQETIRRIALTVEQPTGVESGIAKSLRFQQLNSALTDFAVSMEDLERRAWWIVTRWLGLNETVSVQWSKDYSLADIEGELTELQQMQASGFPFEVIKEKQKAIVGLLLPSLEQDELNALIVAIDQEQPPEPAPAEQPL